jgi:hypothetical protein
MHLVLPTNPADLVSSGGPLVALASEKPGACEIFSLSWSPIPFFPGSLMKTGRNRALSDRHIQNYSVYEG